MGYMGFDQLCEPDVIEISTDATPSTKDAFLEKMTGSGAEFVYTFLHSTESHLAFYYNGVWDRLNINEIEMYDLKGMFYVLSSCYACRYTANCVGMALLMKTTHGLATYGATDTISLIAPMILPVHYRRETHGERRF